MDFFFSKLLEIFYRELIESILKMIKLGIISRVNFAFLV